MSLAQGFELPAQGGIEGDGTVGTGVALLRRAGPVGWQFYHGGNTGQGVFPVRRLLLLLRSFEQGTLPVGVVGVLDRQCRECRVIGQVGRFGL